MEGTKVFIPTSGELSWLPGKVTGVREEENKKGVIETLFSVRLEHVEGACDEATAPEPGTTVDDVNINGIPELSAFTSLPMQNELSRHGCEDMCQLNYLHEPAILYNLRRRFFATLPYTYTGDICIAVNPYQWLDLYTEELQGQYMIRDRQNLPPHVYAVSATSFYHMRKFARNQSILVSGESGAGKTETVKIMMNHLAAAGSGKSDSRIIRKVLDSNPLLESFGNAKTVRNDNSSRFGKFIQLQFDKDAAVVELIGSRCQHYLLEKTRVVSISPGERTYHIFYQLMNVSQQQRDLFCMDKRANEFAFTNSGDINTSMIEGMTDADRYSMTSEALQLVGLESERISLLYRVLTAVLFLGELQFIEVSDQETGIEDMAVAERVGELLSIEVQILKRGLCSRTMKTGSETISVILNPSQAANARDGLAKEIYSKVFDWLVGKINESTAATKSNSERLISLLDIFGFESFEVNRFEQLCINYANEKLQQRFTQDVFKNVQAEYEEEGIQWDVIDFVDNADMLSLIEGRFGIISVLNEECIRPKGSDAGFASKLRTKHKGHARFQEERFSQTDFILRHYAGPVKYTTTGFIDKNKDMLSNDLLEAMKSTANEVLVDVFDYQPDIGIAGKPQSQSSSGKRKGGMMETVTTKFKSQLGTLMSAIGETDVQYVRCIKPNRKKAGNAFNNAMVVDQLRCAGVIEAIRISRAGFPNRMLHGTFTSRFALLVPRDASLSEKDSCLAMAAKLLPEGGPRMYQLGKTKIFFKAGILEMLEDRRNVVIQQQAVKIQSRIRGFLHLMKFRTAKSAAIHLQSFARCRSSAIAFHTKREGAVVVQCAWRCLQSRRSFAYQRRTHASILLQATVRRWLCRALISRSVHAAVKIQSKIRAYLARNQFVQALTNAREEAKLENQMRALQSRMKEREEDTKNKEELLQSSQDMIETLRKEVEKVRKERDDLKSENADLKNSLALSRNAATDSAKTTAVSWELSKLKEENEALKQDLYQLTLNTKALSCLAAKLEQAEKENQQLVSRSHQTKEELEMQKAQYKDAEERNAQKQEALDECIIAAVEYGAGEGLVSTLRNIASPNLHNEEKLRDLERRVEQGRNHHRVPFVGGALRWFSSS